MAKVQLFANWTWKISLPEPFDKSTNVSTDHYSSFETIEAVITELDYHQTVIKGGGSVALPQSAYV